MTLLTLGIVLFAGVHFIPSLAPGLKAAWMAKMGEGGYKGIFSLLLLASFGLMIIGWRSTTPSLLYVPPAVLHIPALGLMAVAFLIMGASNLNSRIRLIIRHPQLTGVALWGIAHLILNGDNRSVLLFGGMAAWAVFEMLAINRREGVWIKGETPGWGAELILLVTAAIVVAVLVAIHPWLSGVAVW